MQEVAGERGGYLHGRGALDSDDLLYLKEQMEAEEDAERLLRRTEKRAFAAFKIPFFYTKTAPIILLAFSPFQILFLKIFSFLFHKAASLADSAPPPLPLPLRVEPKPKSGIRQQDLLKKIVEVKPKKSRLSSSSGQTQFCESNQISPQPSLTATTEHRDECPSAPSQALSFERSEMNTRNAPSASARPSGVDSGTENPIKSLLGIAYESSDED
ncbi:hypothetical protein KSP40_PGU005745 [Platanthera guangdongensis]|uniref:Uncharacterized protein n=1 Tax=Platanthera guangdongensis TaxID=2320717 RepID=A0ABR2LMR9_9ASPA